MGVATLRRDRKRPKQGATLWHNPTKTALIVRVREGNYQQNREVEPGGNVSLPAALTDKVVKGLAPQLVKANADGTPVAKVKPKPRVAEVHEKTEPLGDGSNPRTVEDDDGAEVDSERTSDDALEKFALDLEEKNSHKKLQDMATELSVAIGGRKIDIARRLAKKMSK